jgi:hypothetical protein
MKIVELHPEEPLLLVIKKIFHTDGRVQAISRIEFDLYLLNYRDKTLNQRKVDLPDLQDLPKKV